MWWKEMHFHSAIQPRNGIKNYGCCLLKFNVFYRQWQSRWEFLGNDNHNNTWSINMVFTAVRLWISLLSLLKQTEPSTLCSFSSSLPVICLTIPHPIDFKKKTRQTKWVECKQTNKDDLDWVSMESTFLCWNWFENRALKKWNLEFQT